MGSLCVVVVAVAGDASYASISGFAMECPTSRAMKEFRFRAASFLARLRATVTL